jgi:hypothetical protein
VVDLTFIGSGTAWALGIADCLGGPGRCPAMASTTDGRHWHSMAGPDAKVATSCIDTDDCVSNLRFASPTIGYAFGPSTLFTTDDGGAHWTRQAGGADALEPLDGNVIRVLTSGSGCPGPCIKDVETAPVGSSQWTVATFTPPKSTVSGLSLARTGSDAYLLVTANPAGGAPQQTSHLYGSSDDGTTWSDDGEPCRQLPGGGEVDSTAITTAPDGAVVVSCMRRTPPHRISVAVSIDGGQTFSQRATFGSGSVAAVAAASATDLLAVAGSLYDSTDGGRHFTRVEHGPNRPTWLGFETSSTGHAIEQPHAGQDGGSVFWTTADGGRSWSSYRFP